MEWIEQGLIALVISLLALAGLMLVMTASSLTQLRFRRSSVSMVGRDDMPKQVRLTLDKAQPLLTDLGFHYRYSTASEASVATDSHPHVFSDVYQHLDGHTHAVVAPSMAPEQGEPCAVMWVTLLENDKAFATVNCYLHNLISAPAGWVMHDDYLPDLHEAWSRHRHRLLFANEAIVHEGVEFLRANRLATEQLMPYCEQQGLLIRQDDHWQMPWLVAFRSAWKQFIGRRKVAKARVLTIKRSSPPKTSFGVAAAPMPQNTVEADIEAFEQQLAIQRATRWTTQKKIKVFLLSAALFLGIGSLWISRTFLPILLIVIGLHEGGHYLAMKISGYRNLSVFFLPGLGGLASGEKASASPWEKLLVYLAGPMPGIVLAVGGLIGQLTGAFQLPGWFLEFLLACLVINYLNLLPFTPLDGGRVVETFLFARFPVARFLFAVLGLAAFLAFGFSTDDKVILVIAVFTGLSLPYQWRIMCVDRAIARHGSETLDEHGAIERVFMALQHPRFAGWTFAMRAVAVKALLPELQGRRAGAIEAAAGITIYMACLFAPPVVAFLAFPQLGAVATRFMAAYSRVADDVDPEPTPSQASVPPRDWYAEATQVQSLAESQRLPVLLGAAEFAEDSDDEEKRDGFLKAAWEIAQKRPAQDYERARTLMAMARATEQTELQRQWHRQVVSELEGLRDKPSLLLLAEAKDSLAWEEDTTGAERVALMGQVVAHREEAMVEGEHALVRARLSFAQALDAENKPEQAEALLRRNIQGIPAPGPSDRSRKALHQRIRQMQAHIELAWFFNAHERPREASAVLDTAEAMLPTKISVSWEFPNQQLRETQLWTMLQHADVQSVTASWQRYEKSRSRIPRGKSPLLLHELDRLIVAQSIADESLKAQAQASILEALKGSQNKFVQSRLCNEHELSRRWRSKQQEARIEAAKTVGICGKV